MPATNLGFTQTTAVLGGNRTMKVNQWRAYAQPSNTYFEFAARTSTTRAQAQGIANGVADTIEDVLGMADVTDVIWSQDVTPGGQLQGIFTVYWHLEADDASGFAEVPYTRFNPANVATAIAAAASAGPSPVF